MRATKLQYAFKTAEKYKDHSVDIIKILGDLGKKFSLAESSFLFKFVNQLCEEYSQSGSHHELLNRLAGIPEKDSPSNKMEKFITICFSSQFTYSEAAQNFLAYAFNSIDLVAHSELLPTLFSRISHVSWTSDHAQFVLADAIVQKGLLDSKKSGSAELSASIGRIEWSSITAVMCLSEAIVQNRLNDSSLRILAESIGKIDWTLSREAQIQLITAMQAGKFGSNLLVLQHLIASIGKVWPHISSDAPKIQIALVGFISQFLNTLKDESLYTRKEMRSLKILLADFIGKVSWTSPHAKMNLAKEIAIGAFGTDPLVLKHLVRSIGQIRWNDSDASFYLGLALKNDVFGKDVHILNTLAISMKHIHWARVGSFPIFLESLREGKFGRDQEVLQNLAKSIGRIDWRSLTDQEQFDLLDVIQNTFGKQNERTLKHEFTEETANLIANISWGATLKQMLISRVAKGEFVGSDNKSDRILHNFVQKFEEDVKHFNEDIQIHFDEIKSKITDKELGQ